MSAAERLRQFKLRARALPDAEKRAAFASNEFKSLVARAATEALPEAIVQCAGHCNGHCVAHG